MILYPPAAFLIKPLLEGSQVILWLRCPGLPVVSLTNGSASARTVGRACSLNFLFFFHCSTLSFSITEYLKHFLRPLGGCLRNFFALFFSMLNAFSSTADYLQYISRLVKAFRFFKDPKCNGCGMASGDGWDSLRGWLWDGLRGWVG